MTRRTGAFIVAMVITAISACSTSIPGRAIGTAAAGSSIATGDPTEPTGDIDPTGEVTPDQTGGGTGTGDYRTTPNELPATAGSEEAGRLAEAARLAEYVVVPTFVFNDYYYDESETTLLIKDSATLGKLVADPIPARADANGMIAGFSSTRQTDESGSADYFSNILINAVLAFPSPEQATKAAAEMNEGIGAREGGTNVVTVPGFDQTLAKVRSTSSQGVSAETFVAHNSVVHYVLNRTYDDSSESMAQTLATLLETQIPASENYTPTQVENLSRLPADREGMLAHTLLLPTDSESYDDTSNRTYGIRAMKNFFINPLDDEPTMVAASVDLVSTGLTTVYRAKDETAALLVQSEFSTQYTNYYPDAEKREAPPEVPGAECVGVDDNTLCVFTRGRYTVEASGSADRDYQAIVLAQYELLKDF